MRRLREIWQAARVRHALIAAALALFCGALGLLSPLNGQWWGVQSLAVQRPASGEIIFVGAASDLSNPANSRGRAELARLVQNLSVNGAKRLFLHISFERPSTTVADQSLGESIAASKQTVLVRRYITTTVGEREISSIPAIAGKAPEVSSKRWIDPFGYTWFATYSGPRRDTVFQTLSEAAAGYTGQGQGDFPIDYSTSYQSIPKYTVSEATALAPSGRFRDKTIIIGNGGSGMEVYASIPGHPRVPASMVAIYAAETLKRGAPTFVSWHISLFAAACLLLGITLAIREARARRIAYSCVAALLLPLFVALAYSRTVVELAEPLLFLTTFALLRLWSFQQTRSAIVDPLSGLPTLRKLEQDIKANDPEGNHAVIVAKIHNFEEVIALLPSELHGEYISLVANRLKITDNKNPIYTSGGRYLFWTQQDASKEVIQAHLLGLRAVLAQPISVGLTMVDVGITFGVDASRDTEPQRKIARARSAVEKTSEAHLPLLFVDGRVEADALWQISLQGKIDQALHSGEIYVVYQPQIELVTGLLMGVEALVRWRDPERGDIPPSYFIEQCEQAGRMAALTRKVCEEALGALGRSHLLAGAFKLSVNVSATLLRNFDVADMLEELLDSLSFPANHLTIEVTETARISDYETAAAVMRRLQALGIRLSADDFGVGAASLETFLILPFDELKIDRGFTAKLLQSEKADAIVRSVISLGKTLKLHVIAEGVEDLATLKRLQFLGCDSAQGYFVGRPASLESSFRHAAADSAKVVQSG